MAQLSLRERLQPALFDRLIDDARWLTCYEFTFHREALRQLGIGERDLVGILTAQGLRRPDDEDDSSDANDQTVRIRLVAPGGRITLSQLKSLVLKPPARPEGVMLQSFCEVTARNVLNTATESGEQATVSMRRLREYVCRDLSALLNCASLEAVVDLSRYPYVRDSVLNFGMPSLAGRVARTVDPQQIASTIETAIRRFEPRLSGVRVYPEMGEEGNETHVLAFRIEALLWGQPVPQGLLLRTAIDVDTGNVDIADSGVK